MASDDCQLRNIRTILEQVLKYPPKCSVLLLAKVSNHFHLESVHFHIIISDSNFELEPPKAQFVMKMGI